MPLLGYGSKGSSGRGRRKGGLGLGALTGPLTKKLGVKKRKGTGASDTSGGNTRTRARSSSRASASSRKKSAGRGR